MSLFLEPCESTFLHQLLDTLIPGFATYAKLRAHANKRTVSGFDLMCWALCCGDIDLALLMWEKSDDVAAGTCSNCERRCMPLQIL